MSEYDTSKASECTHTRRRSSCSITGDILVGKKVIETYQKWFDKEGIHLSKRV
jgi:hypothetical protein